MMAAVVFVIGALAGYLFGAWRNGQQMDDMAQRYLRVSRERDEAQEALADVQMDAAELRVTLEGIKQTRSEAGKKAWERRRAS